jgi:glycosyltransferase involved in cell wall biosynthesis
MRVAMVSFCRPGVTFAEIPRGTFAVLHYLEAFGHEVLHLDRGTSVNPIRLLATLRRWRPDVVLVQHLVGCLVGMFRRAGVIGCPVVHAWDDYYAEQSSLPRWVAWPMEVWSIRWADHVVSVSAYNLSLARKWGKPCELIPHGTHEPQRPTSLRLESSRVKVVHLGEQSVYKRTPQLIEAVRGLDCDLYLVGSVNEALRPGAPANAHFVGPVSPEEIQAVLAQADILVNPSDQDSNFKFFEYIKAGKPILGVKGRAECAFCDGVDALLVDDLRAGLGRLIGSPELRAQLAAGVRRRESLTWEQVVRRVEGVLLRVSDIGEKAGE